MQTLQGTITYHQRDLERVVQQLHRCMESAAVFTFTGPLGAGKTTIIRALLERCGITEPVTSPTFTYVNIYTNQQGQHFYHFDLYRIDSLDEFIAAGFNEYLYAEDSWCFIEWPGLIMPLVQERLCRVTIDYVSEHERTLHYGVTSHNKKNHG